MGRDKFNYGGVGLQAETGGVEKIKRQFMGHTVFVVFM